MDTLQTKIISYGAYNIEAAINSEKDVFVSIPTLEKLLNWKSNSGRKKLASESLKTFAGKDLMVGKIYGLTDSTKGKANKVALIPLEVFTIILTWAGFGRENNEIAKSMVVSGFTTDIKSTILEAFGHEAAIDSLRLQEQFKWLRIFQLREWTDVIRNRHLELFGIKPSSEYYRECIVMVNLALFDRKHFKCDRDTMDIDQQELIRDFEKMLVRQSKKYPDYDPKELITLTLPMF